MRLTMCTKNNSYLITTIRTIFHETPCHVECFVIDFFFYNNIQILFRQVIQYTVNVSHLFIEYN